MNTIKKYTMSFGCDPEFFFTSKGKIIGAEKVLPTHGLEYDTCSHKNGWDKVGTVVGGGKSKIIIDGVQAELNPRPNTCRANLANELSSCFRELYEKLSKDGYGIDFSQAVNVSKKELESLSEKSRKFGCAKSFNAHKNGGASVIGVDPTVYRTRSAGGHIHLGDAPNRDDSPVLKALKSPKRIIPMLDIVVGNTCVLLDRDPSNIERRKVYGRAGEYRTPSYGIEYRTLSNFWLREYRLMSMVFGLARQAVCIVASSNEENNFEELIRDRVDIKDIEDAINHNDYDLALSNYHKIIDALIEITPTACDFTIDRDNVYLFDYFISKGTDYWFAGDILEHWIHLPEGHNTGFEEFLLGKVNNDYVKHH